MAKYLYIFAITCYCYLFVCRLLLYGILQSVKNRVRGDFSNSSGISIVFLHF